ncbi:MAG: lipoprotein LprG [Frankiales bacterium]|nr:lipoprotein LprG [Frankiales bacterium]
MLLVLAGAIALTGCGGGKKTDPQELIAQAKATLDTTAGLHFELTSSGTPKSGTVIVGGTGDVARPDGFKGSITVSRSGLQFSIEVVSVGGSVYIKPPLVSAYTKADPKQYGFSDPGKLLNPTTGISRLLAELTSVKSAGQDRFAGEVLDEVDVNLPGSAVEQVLTSADPSKPVVGKLGIAGKKGELRRAVLTGPFLDKNVQTTFTIVLDHYGTHPTISAPA